MATKTLYNFQVPTALYQSPGGPEAQAGDLVRIYLDQTRNAAFPEYIEGTLQMPVKRVSILTGDCLTEGTSYSLEYDSDDLAGAADHIDACDVLEVSVTSCCLILRDALDDEIAARDAADTALQTELDEWDVIELDAPPVQGSLGTNQVETNTATGNVTSSGFAAVEIVSASVNKTLFFEVLAGDTPTLWAAKAVIRLLADEDVTDNFIPSSSGGDVTLTAVSPASANDATLEFTLRNETSVGITETTSVNTTPGVAAVVGTVAARLGQHAHFGGRIYEATDLTPMTWREIWRYDDTTAGGLGAADERLTPRLGAAGELTVSDSVTIEDDGTRQAKIRADADATLGLNMTDASGNVLTVYANPLTGNRDIKWANGSGTTGLVTSANGNILRSDITDSTAIGRAIMAADIDRLAFGTGAPNNADGYDGLGYLNLTNGILYQKAAGAWSIVFAPGDVVFNVLDYGAAGDGVTEDQAAINAAIQAAHEAGGGTVYFPSGTYRVERALQAEVDPYWTTFNDGGSLPCLMLLDKVHLRGEGSDVSVVQMPSTEGSLSMFKAFGIGNFTITNLGFEGGRDPADYNVWTDYGDSEIIDLKDRCFAWTVSHCRFENVLTEAIDNDVDTLEYDDYEGSYPKSVVTGCVFRNVGGVGVHNAIWTVVENCVFEKVAMARLAGALAAEPGTLGQGAIDGSGHEVTVRNCWFDTCARILHAYFPLPGTVDARNCLIENCFATGTTDDVDAAIAGNTFVTVRDTTIVGANPRVNGCGVLERCVLEADWSVTNLANITVPAGGSMIGNKITGFGVLVNGAKCQVIDNVIDRTQSTLNDECIDTPYSTNNDCLIKGNRVLASTVAGITAPVIGSTATSTQARNIIIGNVVDGGGRSNHLVRVRNDSTVIGNVLLNGSSSSITIGNDDSSATGNNVIIGNRSNVPMTIRAGSTGNRIEGNLPDKPEIVVTNTPASGFALTSTQYYDSTYYLTPAGTLATGTFNLASSSNARVGQITRIHSTEEVTSFTLAVSGGGTINGTVPSTLAADTTYAFQCVSTAGAGTWIVL